MGNAFKFFAGKMVERLTPKWGELEVPKRLESFGPHWQFKVTVDHNKVVRCYVAYRFAYSDQAVTVGDKLGAIRDALLCLVTKIPKEDAKAHDDLRRMVDYLNNRIAGEMKGGLLNFLFGDHD